MGVLLVEVVGNFKFWERWSQARSL